MTHPKSSVKKIADGKKNYVDAYHHPEEKIKQLEETFPDPLFNSKHKVLELFAGPDANGNLTKWYRQHVGSVDAFDESVTGDSYRNIHGLIHEGKKYDVIDIDDYGWPSEMFPNVFKLCKDSTMLIITFPRPGTCNLNKTLEMKFMTYWGSRCPTPGDVVGRITDEAVKYWYIPTLLDYRLIHPIYRFVFWCRRVNANVLSGKGNPNCIPNEKEN